MNRIEFNHLISWTTALVLAFSLFACAGAGENSNADSTGGSGTTTATGAATDGTGSADGGATTAGTTEGSSDAGEELPVSCTTEISGAFGIPEADIQYSGQKVTVSATHLQNLGCVNSLDVTATIDGGCQLILSFETVDNEWALTDGALTGDEKCGEFYPVENHGAYILDAVSTRAGIVGLPNSVDNAESTDSCATPESTVQLIGTAQFKSATSNEILQIRLAGLALNGSIHSVATPDGDCPKSFDACTTGGVCGTNAFDIDCGACVSGADCFLGYCKDALSACNPKGTGIVVGDLIADVTWSDSDGKPLNLHGSCGSASAIWLTKTAGW